MNQVNVLSLFDGISCGKVALERVGFTAGNYYASEIDKHAENMSEYNHPGIIRLGDVTKWREWDIDWSSIDLLFAGFPCIDWSVAGKQRGDKGKTGSLVHTLIEIWNHLTDKNPNLKFLFENVKMKKEFIEYLNNLFDTEPVLINSASVSAQNRKRLYWTNIEGIEQPEDKGILLKDIVMENTDPEFNISDWIHSEKALEYMDREDRSGRTKWDHDHHSNYFEDKSKCLVANTFKGVPYNVLYVPFDKTLQLLDKEVQRGKIGYFRKDSQANRVYSIHGKSVTLCGEAGGGAAKMGQYLFGCITPDRLNKKQNGQRFSDGTKFYTLTAQDKHGILIDGYIRKLHPVECERLQTLPDGYTDVPGVSLTQRYKALGNGWTVEVISHILKNLKG